MKGKFYIGDYQNVYCDKCDEEAKPKYFCPNCDQSPVDLLESLVNAVYGQVRISGQESMGLKSVRKEVEKFLNINRTDLRD